MFCELHTRSAFSFLSSGSQPEMLVAEAARLSMPALGLLDRDTLAGAVRFHFEAAEAGIKPIIGAEITMEDGRLLPLVPLNLEGYRNLSRLITTIKLRSKKGLHFATRRDIEEHSVGLLCFTGGADGFVCGQILSGRGQEALAWLKYVFGDRLYVELQRHHLRSEEAINQSLLGLAHKIRVPYFASNGAYYAAEPDRELLDVFTCIRNHTTIFEAGRLLSENSERCLKSEAAMLRLFSDLPEAVRITEEIADRIEFSLDELAYSFPEYPVPPGETMDSMLRRMVFERSHQRYLHTPWALRAQVGGRLEKELRVIEQKRLAGYFLVVNDISDFCRANGILSQGRGSAANSVVCYSLGITAVEPIANRLLFERFLSEKYDRYPDIDIDLPSGEDRERVIQYVYRKYGERGAGMTANVITYRGRSAIREVGKVFGLDAETIGRLSKFASHYETLADEKIAELLRESGLDPGRRPVLQKFLSVYRRILSFPRHLGQHSGGMVISLDRLDGITPIEPASMPGRNIIQWDKDDCEMLRIVKVDLLGLGMMAVLRDSIELIRRHYGDDMDLYKVPHDDVKVYEALQKGDTVGMFQVESRAQIAFLPKSKPRNFYDIVVQVAIIRPGPIVGDMLNSYIRRRQGLEEIDCIHPLLQPTLERTLGVPLFQEQLLKIAMDIAGFSGSEAEELRRAMGFKRPDRKMEKIERNLRNGMIRNGIPDDVQERIVAYVKAFANYGFPESHAYSFALLAYASAYFAVHYRAAFTAAMLNNYPLGFYTPATLIKDAQRHGLHFRHVDINRSDYDFTVVENEAGEKEVQTGLRYVKGLREETGRLIVRRREDGYYSSVEDLALRVPELNKREMRALSLAGALNFGNTVHRRQALWQGELALRPSGPLLTPAVFDQPCLEETISDQQTGTASESVNHNGETPPEQHPPAYIEPMHGLELVDADLRHLGMTIGKHPMAFVRRQMDHEGILSAEATHRLAPGEIVSVAGAVIVRQMPMTAKKVVFMTLEDETGFSNFVVMPDIYEKYREIINSSGFLVIRGIFEERGMIKALHFRPLRIAATAAGSHDYR